MPKPRFVQICTVRLVRYKSAINKCVPPAHERYGDESAGLRGTTSFSTPSPRSPMDRIFPSRKHTPDSNRFNGVNVKQRQSSLHFDVTALPDMNRTMVFAGAARPKVARPISCETERQRRRFRRHYPLTFGSAWLRNA